MFRKFAIAVVTAATLATGFVATAQAAPADFHRVDEHWHGERFSRFEVLTRCGGRWDVHATYRDREAAEHAARELRHHGMDVQVRRI